MTPSGGPGDGFRAAELKAAFDDARVDGTVVAVHAMNDDLLVDGDALRHATHVLAAHAATAGMATLSWDLAEGVRALDAPGGPAASVPRKLASGTPATVAIEEIARHLLGADRPHLLLLRWMEHVVPADQAAAATGDVARVIEQIAGFATGTALRKRGHVVVLLSHHGQLPSSVTQLPGLSLVDLGLPGPGERRAAIELMVRSERHPLVLAPGFDADEASRVTGALPLQTVSVLREHTSPEAPLTSDIVRERGRAAFERALRDIARVDVTRVELGRDLVGLPQLVRVIQDHRTDPDGAIRVGFFGGPGTGKSFGARALATAIGVPLILPETLKEQWVGASERNGVRFLSVLSALAPAIAMLDDQNDQLSADRERGAHDDANGVSGSLTGLFLDRFGDPSGTGMPGVHLVIASNYARRIDPAMRSRITCIPFLPPDIDELAAQMEATARGRGWDLDDGVALAVLREHPRRLTSRDAVTVLAESRRRSLRAGHATIGDEDVLGAVLDYNPAVDRAVERQTLEALEATTFTSHLPWMAARALGSPDAQPPAHLRQFVRVDGSLDHDRVAERIDELEVFRGR